MNLYEALDIPRAADKETVRKAYRRKAKATHPDGGGSVDAFALVKLAHDTLTNDARRARYDETGETTEGGPDQDESNALQIAFGAVTAVLAEMDRRSLAYSDIDVVADARRTVQKQLDALHENIRQIDKKILTAHRVAKRFKAKAGKVNHLEAMMNAQIADLERTKAARDGDRKPLVRALEILADHTYDMSPEARPAAYNSTKDLAYLLNEAMKPGPIDHSPFS